MWHFSIQVPQSAASPVSFPFRMDPVNQICPIKQISACCLSKSNRKDKHVYNHGLPENLSDCVCSATETLDAEDKFSCDTCGCLQEAQKCIRIKQLPRILCLHLKRFKYVEDMQRCALCLQDSLSRGSWLQH